MRLKRIAAALTTIAAVLAATAQPVQAAPDTAGSGFVTRQGSRLLLDGKTFKFGGTNNYYLMYKSRAMVDDVFADARGAGFNVVRTWGFLDIGNEDGSNSVHGKADGVYFQYWDGDSPAYNDGPDGLEQLDYVLYAARQAGIKLVIPLTNNWSDFGGIAQYVRWRGADNHDDFYTDPVIRGWYKDWISHVLNRVNPLTGLAYKDDPTVMTWELGNEPRCKGSGVYPPSGSCTTQTLVTWADEMTRHIKSIDRRHLASVGDEGFYCDDPTSADWTINCGEGVDTIALAKLPAVDVLSYHLYPDGWGKDAAWGTAWIKRHNADARAIGKAVMMGEFGFKDKNLRNPVYQEWLDAFIATGGNGFLYWILSGIQDDGTLYPDYDGFTVYCPSPVCLTISNATAELRHGFAARPPVADADFATTAFDTPVTLRPAVNDIAYRTSVRASSIDLDPAVAGRQTVSGGFTAAADGTVTFTPPAGEFGDFDASYTIRDLAGRTSNVATLRVTVRPPVTPPIQIASFETGTEGWGPASWLGPLGTVAQTTAFATDGTHGLHVDATEGGWFGVALPAPLDLSAKVSLKYDLKVGADAGTNGAIAVQYGSVPSWCQSTFRWVPQNTTTTVTADLRTEMSCDMTALADIRQIYVYISPGSFDLDNVRAE